MKETSLYSVSRKNRREALGLLLGAAFITPAALAQKKTPGSKKNRDIVIIIDDKGAIASNLDPYLQDGEKDRLLLVNLSSDHYSFHFHKIHHPPQGGCVDVPPCSFRLAPLTYNKDFHTSAWYYCKGTSCDCPVPKSGGQITIDQ
jgi:hypothetical protein